MRSVLVLLLMVRVAAADMEIEPPPVFRCREGGSFDRVMKCLRQLGTVTVAASADSARLVHVVQTAGGGYLDYGYVLLVQQGTHWHPRGTIEGGGELLAFAPQTIGAHHGYVLELGNAMPITVELADHSLHTATRVFRSVIYCSGTQQYCTAAMTSCDVLVDGRAVQTFRGTLAVEEHSLVIRGDRSKAGECAPPERTVLDWPEGS